jgi:hypothetical protein
MVQFRKYVDYLKTSCVHACPPAPDTAASPGNVAQPQRRHLQREGNVEGAIPDVIQLDLTKLTTGTFNFGSQEWTLSFEENQNFKKYFYEGERHYIFTAKIFKCYDPVSCLNSCNLSQFSNFLP